MKRGPARIVPLGNSRQGTNATNELAQEQRHVGNVRAPFPKGPKSDSALQAWPASASPRTGQRPTDWRRSTHRRLLRPGRNLGWERWHPSAAIARSAPVGRPAWIVPGTEGAARYLVSGTGTPCPDTDGFMQVIGTGVLWARKRDF